MKFSPYGSPIPLVFAREVSSRNSKGFLPSGRVKQGREFRDISRVSEAITAKRMKIDLYCQRRTCSPLNVLSSDV